MLEKFDKSLPSSRRCRARSFPVVVKMKKSNWFLYHAAHTTVEVELGLITFLKYASLHSKKHLRMKYRLARSSNLYALGMIFESPRSSIVILSIVARKAITDI